LPEPEIQALADVSDFLAMGWKHDEDPSRALEVAVDFFLGKADELVCPERDFVGVKPEQGFPDAAHINLTDFQNPVVRRDGDVADRDQQRFRLAVHQLVFPSPHRSQSPRLIIHQLGQSLRGTRPGHRGELHAPAKNSPHAAPDGRPTKNGGSRLSMREGLKLKIPL